LLLYKFFLLKLTIDPEVNNAWARLTADSSTVSWIACGYPADKNNQLVFKAEGSNGMPEFLGSLGDEIVWGAFKVVGVDDRGNTVSRRPKYIFVKYTPASTTAMKRATAGRHKGAIKPIFTTHVDFEIETADELTEDSVIQKLRASGGAHQPTSYEFSNFSS
jgi:hypothetical protein